MESDPPIPAVTQPQVPDVHTLQGHIPRHKLTTKEFPIENGHSRSLGMEWYLDGQMVRRDAVVHFHGPMHSFVGSVPMVQTAHGPIHRAAITVTDTALEDANGRTIVTEWSHNGQSVRHDQWTVPFVHDSCAGSCTP